MKKFIDLILENKDNKYEKFISYCELKNKGLRKKSFEILEKFIKNLENTGFEEEKEFLIWFFELADKSFETYNVINFQLENKILKPVLKKWIDNSENDSRPFRWYGLYLNEINNLDYLKKAFLIGGVQEQRVLKNICDIYSSSLFYAFHHISEDLYLGNFEENTSEILDLRNFSEKILNEDVREKFKSEANYYENLLNDWKDFKNQNAENFVKWCFIRNKKYHWVKSYYYNK